MALELLEPVVTIISILGFTFLLTHRVEDKLDKLSEKNSEDHNIVNKRLLQIEDKIGLTH